MSSTKSFSSLLAADLRPTTTTTTTRGLGDRIAERTGSGVPKFKSLPPLSFPISPPSLVSPSSYFSIPYGLSPNELLDSPVLLSASTILPSPTTGTFPLQAFNWQSNSSVSSQNINNEKNNLSDFSFQPQTKPPQFCKTVDQTWDYQQTANQEDVESDEPNLKSDFNSMQSFSPEIATIQTDHQTNNTIQSEYNQSLQNSKSGDGYNWRKYGQKQVKGSENPRSYYKCTHPNCPIKKKVEMSLAGQITEIVYRGSHNHPKPQFTRRSSSSSSASSAVIQSHQTRSNDISDYYGGSNGMGKIDSSVATPENSSITVGDDDFEQSSHGGRLVADDIDENEPDAKRWKGESEGISAVAALGRTVREPRVVVQTRSDIDILIDGYRWRKYGQKVVRGNPNPRSYYKCTNPGCPVRKHVERASHDAGAVITTYEGKHNHDVPPARGSTSNNQSLTRPVPTNPDYYTSIATSSPHHNPNHQTPPYTLEMLHSPESFGYSIAKNEPTSHMFPDSFLY